MSHEPTDVPQPSYMSGLTLSGGGSRGSWQAGVLRYLGIAEKGGFQFASGTSVGAINSAGVAMFPPERFPEAAEFCVDMWTKHVKKTSDIWKLRFPFGIPGLWNPSIGSNKAAEKLLSEVVDIQAIQKSGVQVRFSAVDLLTGDLKMFTGVDLLKYGTKPVLASGSFPGAFEPVEIDGHFYTDGGVRDIAPIGAAVRAGCKKVVVVATRALDQATPATEAQVMGNVLKLMHRVVDLMAFEILVNDIKTCQRVNTLVERGLAQDRVRIDLRVITPSVPLGDSLDFSESLMREQIEQGYEDARKIYAVG